jgi:general secretion pathway protein D
VTIGTHDSAVTISSDETNNAILVYATARQYAVVQDALLKLDILPLQVMIEAAITEVTLNDSLKYGVQWYFQKGGQQLALSEGTTARPLQTFPGFSYFFANSTNSINATLDALSDVTTIRVISAPKLMVLNNHTASLQVGDQVPVATQSSVSTDNPGAPIVNSIEYRDTGVILKVTPRVNDSGLVLLDIAQEVSDVASTSTSNIDSPTIQQRKVSSSVAVADGRTIALGGLIRDNLTRTKSGLPLLSRIPVLGILFGSTDNEDKRTELLVLLTPHVVRNPMDAESVTMELQRKLQTLQPLLPAAR